jgi:chromate reductase
MTIRLLGISGSLRRASHNHAVLRAAARSANDGVDFAVYHGQKSVPVFDEDLEDDPPIGVVALRAAVGAADGILLATPEYNQSIPGSTKNLIDWLSRTDHLSDKPVAVIGASTGPWGTRIAQSQLRQMLLAVGALVMPSPTLFIPRASELMDDNGDLVDDKTIRRLTDVVEALTAWTTLHTAPSQSRSPDVHLSSAISGLLWMLDGDDSEVAG